MLKSYVKIAFRSIIRHRGHAFINLAGLSIGISVCILLFLWVQDERSYDRYHEKANQIHRVTTQYESEGQLKRSAGTPAPLGPALVKEFPEVEKAVRFGDNGFLVSYRENCFFERIFFADPEIFEMFSFPVVQGNPQTALKTPHSILISEDIRDKYFGGDDPVGKLINLKGRGDFKITGVFKNIPHNSHFRFDFLGSFPDYAGVNEDKWGISNYYTYVQMSKDFSLRKFESKMPQFVEKYRGKEAVTEYKSTYPLQPLPWIHLHSDLSSEISSNGDIRTIYLFSAVAFFILLLACLNYINLSTARYLKRSRIVGMLKVVGATGPQVIYQFLCESFLFSLIALPFAVLWANFFLPSFNFLSGKQLAIHFITDPFLLFVLVAVCLIVGFISGFFPALFISYLSPVAAIKGISRPDSRLFLLRKSLIIFQFTIAVVFIICTFTILNQLNFMKSKDLGFDEEHIIEIPIYRQTARQKYETIKNELLRETNVKAVSASSFSPDKRPWSVNYWRKGLAPGENPMINCLIVDHDFLKTFSIKILDGRDFSRQFPGDIEGAYILNQSAVKEFGWKSPVGKEFQLGSANKGNVIGVIEDFHFRSFHHKIKPLVLYISPKWFSHFSVKVSPDNMRDTLNILKNKWQELVPDQAFTYSFLKEKVDAIYKTEVRLGKLFIIVTSLSIFIAFLGLFGLAAFTVEQRTKEIGIRKVLGASTMEIVLLLSKEFSRWVVISVVIGWSIGWYIMYKWLQNFAYRTSIGMWTFVLSGLIVLGITLLTVSFKAFGAAVSNPAKTIRYE